MASEDVARALYQIGGVGQWLDMVEISGQHLKNKDNGSTTGLLFDTLLKSMRHCVELMEEEKKENRSNESKKVFILSQNLMLLHEENEIELDEKKNVSFQEKVAYDKDDDIDEKRRCALKKNKTIPLNSKEIIQAASPMKKQRTSSKFYSIRSKYQPLTVVSL
jgi:hypothetical protein